MISAARAEHRADAGVAQVEAAPDQRGDVDREEDVREERVVEPEMRRDRATEIARPEQRADGSGARDEVEDEADDLDHAEDRKVMRLPPELHRTVYCLLRGEQLDHGVEGEEEHGERG